MPRRAVSVVVRPFRRVSGPVRFREYAAIAFNARGTPIASTGHTTKARAFYLARQRWPLAALWCQPEGRIPS
jgi:hypothetical protein